MSRLINTLIAFLQDRITMLQYRIRLLREARDEKLFEKIPQKQAEKKLELLVKSVAKETGTTPKEIYDHANTSPLEGQGDADGKDPGGSTPGSSPEDQQR